jgi:TetR/AcrR family transcriptional regulator, ethionamide resistance regulator
MASARQRSERREQRRNTREEILAAAAQFLRERPYRELSVEVVMGQSGLTRTAFYRHFDDVTDLVLRLLAEVANELYAIAERWIETAPTAFDEAAKAGLRGVVEFFQRNGPLLRAISEAAATDELIEQSYNGFLEQFVDLTTAGFERMVENGVIEFADPRSVALALNLMNERYLLTQFGREPGGDPEVALATLETIWMRTIARTGEPPPPAV